MGLVSCLAKSARTSAKRFGGSLGFFQLISVRIRDNGPGRLASLEESKVLEHNLAIASDLRRFSLASGLIEMIRILVPERQPDSRLFAALKEGLRRASEEAWTGMLPLSLDLAILDALGLAPRLDECAGCGKAPADDVPVRFDPSRGVVCRRCGAHGHALSAQARKVLVRSCGNVMCGSDADHPSSEAALSEARDILDHFIRYHTGRPLKSRSL